MQSCIEIQENVPIAPFTTLGVGGNARYLVSATSVPMAEQAVRFARTDDLPLFVLGGGSNLVVSDHGWNGLALQVGIGGMEQREQDGRIHFDVGAGVEWDHFVSECVGRNFAGVECLSGIPGNVGGTPVQNVGAYGQEVSETISSVTVFDLAESRVRELQASESGFEYRRSIFNSSHRGRYIILRVSYMLIPEGKPALRYADLQNYFAGRCKVPTLGEVRNAVRTIRASKGMLITAGDPDSHSAGSFFKNPVISSAEHAALLVKAAERSLRVPSYPALAEQRKISAAWLVENSGFAKGYVKGNAGISTKHALAIVNRGGAKAAEIVALKDEIQARVHETWGVRLEAEPVFVGF
ncbi:MAG TPA: UDP-N-acetylmuramate dehydrogenase [Terriglobales bacterium]|jgi:UDP-N-acetylmuramate dehydrogenase